MAASAAAVISSSAVSAAAVVPSGSSAGLIGQVVLGNKSLDLDKSVSAGEVESALVVYLANLDYDLVADSNDILNTVNVLDIKWLMWTRPSLPGAISTNAPKSIRRVTTPL